MALSKKVQEMLAAARVTSTEEMEGLGSGVPRISLKKSRFTLKNGADEEKMGEELDIVILNISPAHGFVHTYYEEGYSPGVAEAPDCVSLDGISPLSTSANPVSDRCVTCPMQVWGSAKSMSGGKAKACKDSKHLYAKLADQLDDPDAPIYLLNVTILSLKAFGRYGKELAKDDIPSPVLVITHLEFDDNQSVPVLTFKSLGIMDDDNCELAIEQSAAHGKELQLALASNKPPAQKAIASEPEQTTSEPKPEATDADMTSAVKDW